MKAVASVTGARLVMAFGLVFDSLAALAACWFDAGLAQAAQRIAQRGFLNAAQRMPEVVVCSGEHFDPDIGGDYNSGTHRIRVPVWQLQSGSLDSVLAHELAHADVGLTHGEQDFGGHSRHFFSALLRAGYQAEAERVAQYVNGGQQELQIARATTLPRGGYVQPQIDPQPQRWTRVCEYVPVALLLRLPGGQVVLQRQFQLHCRLVPV